MARFFYVVGAIMTVIALGLPVLQIMASHNPLSPPLSLGVVIVTLASIVQGALPAMILLALGGLLTRLDQIVAIAAKSDPAASDT